MDKATPDVLRKALDGIVDGLVIWYIADDNIDNTKLVFANKGSAKGASHVFPLYIGKTAFEIYEKSMVDYDFAQTWMRVSKTHKPESHSVEYEGQTYDAYFYYVGEGCVAIQYVNTTETTNLHNKIVNIQERLTLLVKGLYVDK